MSLAFIIAVNQLLSRQKEVSTLFGNSLLTQKYKLKERDHTLVFMDSIQTADSIITTLLLAYNLSFAGITTSWDGLHKKAHDTLENKLYVQIYTPLIQILQAINLVIHDTWKTLLLEFSGNLTWEIDWIRAAKIMEDIDFEHRGWYTTKRGIIL